VRGRLGPAGGEPEHDDGGGGEHAGPDGAMATGELHTRPDPDDLIAQTLGPLFFRRVVADRPADDAFIDRVIDDALARAGIGDSDRRAVHVRLR
jgi:hypothetical protein